MARTPEQWREAARKFVAEHGRDAGRDARDAIVAELHTLSTRAPVNVDALRADLAASPKPSIDVDAWSCAVWYRTPEHGEAPSWGTDPYYSRGLLDWYRPAQHRYHAPIVVQGLYDRLYERECVETHSTDRDEYWFAAAHEVPAEQRYWFGRAYRFLTRGIQ